MIKTVPTDAILHISFTILLYLIWQPKSITVHVPLLTDLYKILSLKISSECKVCLYYSRITLLIGEKSSRAAKNYFVKSFNVD